MTLLIITIALTLFYLGLILYFLWGWKRMKSFVIADNPIPKGISVIVPARNEEANISYLIKDLINQHYPPDLFEIIVIDDHSTDQTAQIVGSFKKKNLRLLFLKDFVPKGFVGSSFKKLGISTAISYAKFPLIVTTDADCRVNPNWLSTISSFHQQYAPNMATGPVLIQNPTGLVGWFQALDASAMALITGATLNLRQPILCNGANLSYQANKFNEIDGFDGIDLQPSGDDVLLMQKFHRIFHSVPGFVLHKQAIVYTIPEKSWRTLISQRKRWTSKAGQYRKKGITFVLLLVYFFNASLLALLALSLFYPQFLFWVSVVFTLKISGEALVVGYSAKWFGTKGALTWLVPVSLAYIPYVLLVGFLGIFTPHTWKGRKINP